MQRNQRIILYCLLLIAGAAWTAFTAGPRPDSSAVTSAPLAGFMAPNFTLKAPGGEEYTLADLRGHGVLVNLWASWCPPCRSEMPVIERMYQAYKEQGFVVLAVDMTTQDDASAVLPFVQQHSLTFPVLLDVSGSVASSYRLRSLPSSYFVDPQGLIKQVVIGGPMSEALLRARIEEILE